MAVRYQLFRKSPYLDQSCESLKGQFEISGATLAAEARTK